MTPTPGWIQDMVMRIQSAFLDTPALTLTPAEAARRFGLDHRIGEAFLKALAEAGVLVKGPDGAYSRLIPRAGLASARASRSAFEPWRGNHAA